MFDRMFPIIGRTIGGAIGIWTGWALPGIVLGNDPQRVIEQASFMTLSVVVVQCVHLYDEWCDCRKSQREQRSPYTEN